MKRFLLLIVPLLFASVFVADANACSRCGIFGRGCKFAASTYVAPYVAPVSSNVYVVQNSYPAPLVAQGSTLYQSTGPASYTSAALPLLDANRYFSQELELLRAADQTQALRSERATRAFERVAELHAPALERIAAGQAAQMVLKSAGLDPAHNASGGGSQAVVISRDGDGRMQVTQLNTEQVQRLTTTITQKQTVPGLPVSAAPADGKYPTLTTFCSKCHGVDMAEPKGQFYLGEDVNVAKAMKERFFDITRKVSSRKMPPANAPQPSDEQRAAILNEIEQIIVAQTGGK